jgi:hypothetical protein
MDEAGISAAFEDLRGFACADDTVSTFQMEIDIGSVENNDILAGRLLPSIQRHLTYAGTDRDSRAGFVARKPLDITEEIGSRTSRCDNPVRQIMRGNGH